MVFLFPRDGDMLNETDGEVTGRSLSVSVRVSASHPAGEIYINGIRTVPNGGCYIAAVPLDGYRNTLTAYDAVTGLRSSIVVYWLKHATGKFRLSLDDNIWCLRDLAKNANTYRSIFDNPYFSLLQKAHSLTGTKVNMNIYQRCEDFDLSQMPARYRDEFSANADWLRLAFHAKGNDPEKPYRNVGYAEMLRDYDRVTVEAERFAGPDAISLETTVHFGECTREGIRALRARGVRCLMGYFAINNGAPYVSYYLDLGQTLHLSGRDFWKDNQEDVIFGRINRVLNLGPLSAIIPDLESEKADPHRSGFLELMIHEQYFHPDYPAYLPDYAERVLSAVKWAASNGYRPSWVSDCVFEP